MSLSDLARYDLGKLELAKDVVDYTPPYGEVVSFNFANSADYTSPSGDAVSFVYFNGLAPVEIALAASLAVTADQSLVQVALLDAVAQVPLTAAMTIDFTSIDVDITLAAAIEVGATTDLVHGVALDTVGSVPVTAELAAVHGVALAAVATIPITAAQDIVRGVALDGIALVPTSAAVSVLIERYELRGEVRLGGVLVNRRVRAYQRSSGQLIAEGDTTVGKFALHTGFAPIECYLTPVDLSDGATDWSPPTANRVLAVLANDTA